MVFQGIRNVAVAVALVSMVYSWFLFSDVMELKQRVFCEKCHDATCMEEFQHVQTFRSYSNGKSLEETNAYLALCAAVKERPDDVLEWVRYHHALGFGKFYIMSTDDPIGYEEMKHALKEYILEGLVELYDLPHVNPRTIPLLQVRLYNECLQAARGKHEWVAFWDADEFLVTVESTLPIHIPTALQTFEDVGGLAVSWRTVGPSGHLVRPEEGMILSYRYCTPWSHPDNSEIKTIVHVKYVSHPTTDPHTFVYLNDTFAVDFQNRRVDGHIDPYIAEDWRNLKKAPALALYHYVTKSKEDFSLKTRRGSAMGNRKGWKFYETVERAADQYCNEAVEACARAGLQSCIDSLLQS